MQLILPTGDPSSRIMVVGEFGGQDDERKGAAFSGSGGWELDKMLKEAGMDRQQCFAAYVIPQRPPDGDLSEWIAFKKKDITSDHLELNGRWVLPVVREGYDLLMKQIELVKPTMIIAIGDLALWALTGKTGIAKWRGSMLYSESGVRVLPTYSPSTLFRQWELRPIVVQDLRRAKSYIHQDWLRPKWNFQIRPTFEQAIARLNWLIELCEFEPTKLSVDIETRAFHTACLGIAWTSSDAICIPFMELGKEDGYWSEAEEAEIVFLLYKLLAHRNARIVGQNFIYDAQFISREWHFVPAFARDTMLTHHTLFPEMQKSLDFICSFHNEQYVYWKGDGKTLSADHDEDKHWRYNCEDCVRTYEADTSLQLAVDAMGLREPHDFQQSLFHPVLRMMNTGIRVDRAAQLGMVKRLNALEKELMEDITYMVGYPLNPRSPKQMQQFFYEEMRQPKQFKPMAKGPSCDSAALEKLSAREPCLKPLIEKIEEWRSVQVFLSNFLVDKRDKDGRMRSSYNIGGTVTFRFSSSENPFGSGLNGQNIPRNQD